jgi:hypothetical protein
MANRYRAGLWLATALLLPLLGQPTRADEPPLPQKGSDSHLGVVTCAGSTCHGATKPFQNSSVLQNEFVTWQRQDKHAQAYKVLLNEQSKRIAANLGLASAETATICLDCHADNVPESARGKRFQLSDGVGCEACHGGAQRWLGPHVSGNNSHQDNIKVGLYPSEQPVARAKLCFSCHLGTKDKFTTHRIMGAGHPRLSFELDTFTDIQPAHYQADDDYKRRKGFWSSGQVWAIGQLLAGEQFLELFQTPKYRSNGLFPELSFFDCHACHHSFNQPNWGPRQSTGLGPGVVRLNDANLLMASRIAHRFVPASGERLDQAIRALHLATTQDMAAAQQAAARLQAQIAEVRTSVMQKPVSREDSRALLLQILELGLRGDYSDYAAAEQSVMALAALVNSLKVAGALNARDSERLTTALNGLYAALENEDSYQPARFVAAMKTFQAAVPAGG